MKIKNLLWFRNTRRSFAQPLHSQRPTSARTANLSMTNFVTSPTNKNPLILLKPKVQLNTHKLHKVLYNTTIEQTQSAQKLRFI
jgi:hypothetical protein